jgi:hypothetical protein
MIIAYDHVPPSVTVLTTLKGSKRRQDLVANLDQSLQASVHVVIYSCTVKTAHETAFVILGLQVGVHCSLCTVIKHLRCMYREVMHDNIHIFLHKDGRYT